METIKLLYNVSSSIVSTTVSHFLLGGPPVKTWDYKFHVVYSIIRNTMNFKPGITLEEVRTNTDKRFNPPPKGFRLTTTTIPDWCREKAHELIKEKLINELGEYPVVREEAFWKNCDKLNLEFAVPNGGNPESGDKETLLYVHGGAYLFCSTNTHRQMICKFARKSGCQAASLNYRLAPEYPFPCALEDTLATYLFLISSDSQQLGMGINPKFITIAGDSAGGNLAASFLLLLASLKQFKMVSGGLLLSPWLDLTSSLPSYSTNELDYLPGPELGIELKNNKKGDKGKVGIFNSRKSKPYDFLTELVASGCKTLEEEIINENKHFFTKEKYLNYHLVSPLFTKDFDGLPPIMVIAGDKERLRDEAILFTHRLNAYSLANPDATKHASLPPVTLHIYHSMPHVFQLFAFNSMAKISYVWGSNFIRHCLSSSKAPSTDPKLLKSYPLGNFKANEEVDETKTWAYVIDEKLAMNTFEIDAELERFDKEMVYFSRESGE